MSWFPTLFGAPEGTPDETRRLFDLQGRTLRSRANGRSFAIGAFTLPSLAQLREQVAAGSGPAGRPAIRIVQGDVRKMHQMPEYAGALFQVASQFNMLEMIGPSVRPEDGIARYEHDRTQGPACALAAGAATVYRNYFVPVPGREGEPDQAGQTADRQLDGLADVGAELSIRLGQPIDLGMRNGYCLPSGATLDLIANHLRAASPEQLDALAARLRIGIHRDVEVTDGAAPGQQVSQAFCSALPVAYGRMPQQHWTEFAQLVLDAAYEATLCEAVLNARRGASNIVLLTLLGGGAFGNAAEWIYLAIERALKKARGFDLDVRLVSYGAPSAQLRQWVASASGAVS
jgi:hypothetical protein